MSQIITATLTLCNDDDIEFETTVVLTGTREQLDTTTIFDEPEYAGLFIAGVDYEPNLWTMYAPGGNFCRIIKETPLYCIYENEPFTVPARFSFQATPALFQHPNAGWGDSFETLPEAEENALAAARTNIETMKRTIEYLEKHLP